MSLDTGKLVVALVVPSDVVNAGVLTGPLLVNGLSLRVEEVSGGLIAIDSDDTRVLPVVERSSVVSLVERLSVLSEFERLDEFPVAAEPETLLVLT